MYSGVLYSFTIGFVAAILFLLVDKYEPKGPLAPLLKFLILFVVAWRSAQIAALRSCTVLAERECADIADPAPTLNPIKLRIRPSLRSTIPSSYGLGEGMPWTTTRSL
jgi:hypothetical protein